MPNPDFNEAIATIAGGAAKLLAAVGISDTEDVGDQARAAALDVALHVWSATYPLPSNG